MMDLVQVFEQAYYKQNVYHWLHALFMAGRSRTAARSCRRAMRNTLIRRMIASFVSFVKVHSPGTRTADIGAGLQVKLRPYHRKRKRANAGWINDRCV